MTWYIFLEFEILTLYIFIEIEITAGDIFIVFEIMTWDIFLETLMTICNMIVLNMQNMVFCIISKIIGAVVRMRLAHYCAAAGNLKAASIYAQEAQYVIQLIKNSLTMKFEFMNVYHVWLVLICCFWRRRFGNGRINWATSFFGFYCSFFIQCFLRSIFFKAKITWMLAYVSITRLFTITVWFGSWNITKSVFHV